MDTLTQRHTHTNIRILHHLRKLLKTNLPIMIQIRLHNRLINNLLQLLIFQITPHHHLQHNEQFTIANVAVSVDIVDFEGEFELVFFVASGGKGAEAVDEFLEVDVAASVFVEDGDHSVYNLEEAVYVQAVWPLPRSKGIR